MKFSLRGLVSSAREVFSRAVASITGKNALDNADDYIDELEHVVDEFEAAAIESDIQAELSYASLDEPEIDAPEIDELVELSGFYDDDDDDSEGGGPDSEPFDSRKNDLDWYLSQIHEGDLSAQYSAKFLARELGQFYVDLVSDAIYVAESRRQENLIAAAERVAEIAEAATAGLATLDDLREPYAQVLKLLETGQEKMATGLFDTLQNVERFMRGEISFITSDAELQDFEKAEVVSFEKILELWEEQGKSDKFRKSFENVYEAQSYVAEIGASQYFYIVEYESGGAEIYENEM